MLPSDYFESTDLPPSPPRLKSTDLPDDTGGRAAEPKQLFGGHPILPEDADIKDPDLNERFLKECMESESPLISPPEAISVLEREYSNSFTFLAQINDLIDEGYNIIIRVKGDGDCFYRALAFAYLNHLMRCPERNKEAQLFATAGILASAGFDDNVYGQPYEILQDLIGVGNTSHKDLEEELWRSFTDLMTSNYIVMYMRLLTSAQMRVHAELADFIFNPESQMPTSVDDFCKQFVEPLGKEADHLQVNALIQALGAHVKVAYMDGHANRVEYVNFSEGKGGAEPLVLLYRPGHYDILQKGT